MEDSSAGSFGGKMTALLPYAVTIVSVILLLGAAGFLGWHVFSANGEDTAILRFIALLIIFMVALATTAAVFVSLKMGNSGEAFGLPSGSIRALLAMGIMMLFVVFGLPVISSHGEEVEPVRLSVAFEQLDATLRANREQGFYAQILDSGAAATATAPSRPAAIRILGRMPSQSAAQLDLTKQLLTAIITLLTTVIGFYFGSRTSTEAVREASAGPDLRTEHGGGSTGGGNPADPATLRRQIETEFMPIKSQIEAAAGEIEQKVGELATNPDPAREVALAALAPLRTNAEKSVQAIQTELEAAAAESASRTEATTANERARSEAEERNRLAVAKAMLPVLVSAAAIFLGAARQKAP